LLIVPPAADVALAAEAMAGVLGGSAYDQRQILLKHMPLATGFQLDTARAARTLAAAGLPAWDLPARVLDTLAEVQEVRGFTLTDTTLEAKLARGESLSLPWNAIELLLKARTSFEQTATTETTKRKTNLAALAIGLPIGGTKTTKEQSQQFGDTWFTLLCARRPGVVLRLGRDDLDYAGLGSAKGPGALVNYLRLLEHIEPRCQGAVRDPRLEKAAGRIAPVPAEARTSVTRSGKTRVAEALASADNAEAIAFAGQLLWLAEKLRRAGIAPGSSL